MPPPSDRLAPVLALADQLDREARTGGRYAEIRRAHAARIRHAADAGQPPAGAR